MTDRTGPETAVSLNDHVEAVRAGLEAANQAREVALPGCRAVIRLCGSSIKAVHRLQPDMATELLEAAETELRAVHAAVDGHPAIEHAGFLHDAEKEYVEARTTAVLIGGGALPGPTELAVDPTAWMRGLAEAASEIRRHLLDRLRDGELDRGEALLRVMDDVYDALVVIDYPDAITNGLRRTLDALRAVLERTRGDVTTTVMQTRLQRAIEARSER